MIPKEELSALDRIRIDNGNVYLFDVIDAFLVNNAHGIYNNHVSKWLHQIQGRFIIMRSEIHEYMKDEASCLQDWYRDYHSLELFPGEPVAILPSMDEIRKAFSEWVDRRREQLFNLICVEWEYQEKRKEEKFQDKIVLAASLAEFLTSLAIGFPAPVATSVLLVRMGLDEFCGV